MPQEGLAPRNNEAGGAARDTRSLDSARDDSDSYGTAFASKFELRIASLMMMMFFALAHRYHAPMRHFAHGMLELNGRVVDSEVVIQALFHIAQNALAGGRRNVGNRDVTRQRAGFRAKAPDVKIVNIVDALNIANGGFDAIKLHSSRRAFEKNVQGLAHNAEARP